MVSTDGHDQGIGVAGKIIMTRLYKKIVKKIFMPLLSMLMLTILSGTLTSAVTAQSSGSLSLEATPSPFAINLNPNTTTTLDLQIRNKNRNTENLKIEARPLIVTEKGDVRFGSSKDLKMRDWIEFRTPEFRLGPSQWTDQAIVLKIPADAGYNYAFALVISRTESSKPVKKVQSTDDFVVVPALINVSKSGTSRKLEDQNIIATARLHEHLPVPINIKIKNTGNMAVLPRGTVEIREGSKSGKVIATLPINEKKDYIIPGGTRVFVANWTQTKDLRFGRYTAKIITVYNDGLRDVTTEKYVSFWILPWRAIFGLILLVVGAVALTVFLLNRKTKQPPPIRSKKKMSKKKD